MSYPAKEIVRNFLSVVAGVVTGIITFTLLAFFFFYTGMLIWTDGGSKEDIARIETNAAVSELAIVTISSVIAGFTTALISTKRDIIHSVISGLILLLIIVEITDFDFETPPKAELIGILLILPLSVFGGWIGIMYKKSKHSGS